MSEFRKPLWVDCDEDEIDEIAYFTVRWKTRASFVYRTVGLVTYFVTVFVIVVYSPQTSVPQRRSFVVIYARNMLHINHTTPVNK